VQKRGAQWLVPSIAAAMVVAVLVGLGVDDVDAEGPVDTSNLRVRGNRLVTPSGEQVVLRGVNRMGFEYSCMQGKGIFDAGAPLDQASVDAMKTWKINAVRLPLNEHCWLGLGGTPSGDAYRQGVERYVDLLLANDLYVIVDLHWSAVRPAVAHQQDPMPNTEHSADFWRSVAGHFKGDDRVLFDLFNEPTPNNNENDNTDEAARRSWLCWRDGAAGGACDATQMRGMTGDKVAGMQSLVDAVRATGATNVIMVGGIQFANTLWSSPTHNWLTYKPRDPLGKLVASWHTYNTTWCRIVACFEREVAPVAAEVPVVAGEIGNDECDATWMNTLMSWLEDQRVGYLAWVWHTATPDDCASKHLIQNYAGTPSPYGEIFRAYLASLIPPAAPSRP
jgi:endoglucanase